MAVSGGKIRVEFPMAIFWGLHVEIQLNQMQLAFFGTKPPQF